jgi:NhaP-type Na+/H+ or K+/H+ antiporter
LAALLIFSAQISPAWLREIGLSGYAFAILALVLVRPIALEISLLGSELSWKERLVIAWFGPKGFSSVVYGLLVLQFGGPDADELFHLITVTIAVSIIAHSSTDVPVAHLFKQPHKASAQS